MSNDSLESEEELDFCVESLPKHFAHGGARVIWNHTGECVEAQCEIGDSRRRHKVIYADGHQDRFGWKDSDEELLVLYLRQMSESDYKTFQKAMKLSSDERIVPKSSHQPSRKPSPARKAAPSDKLSSEERIVPKSSHQPSRKPSPARKAAPSDKHDKLHSSAKPNDQQPKGPRIRRSGRDKKWHDDTVNKVLAGTLNVREDGTKFYFKIVDKVPCTVHVEKDPGTDEDVFVLTRKGRRVVYDDPSKQETEFERHYANLEATLGPDCELLMDKKKFSNHLKTTVEITAYHDDSSSFYSKWWNKRKTQSADLAARKEALLRKVAQKPSSRAAKASEPGPTIVPPSHSKPPACAPKAARAPKATRRVAFDLTVSLDSANMSADRLFQVESHTYSQFLLVPHYRRSRHLFRNLLSPSCLLAALSPKFRHQTVWTAKTGRSRSRVRPKRSSNTCSGR